MPRVGRCDIGAYEEVMPLHFSGKTASVLVAEPGDSLTYTVSLNNFETVDVAGVRVTDSLPTLVTYIENSLTATGGSYGYANGVVTWTGAVSAGGTVAIRYGVTVSETAPLGAFITNTAVISGGGEIVSRTATVFVRHRFYLPLVMRGGS